MRHCCRAEPSQFLQALSVLYGLCFTVCYPTLAISPQKCKRKWSEKAWNSKFSWEGACPQTPQFALPQQIWWLQPWPPKHPDHKVLITNSKGTGAKMVGANWWKQWDVRNSEVSLRTLFHPCYLLCSIKDATNWHIFMLSSLPFFAVLLPYIFNVFYYLLFSGYPGASWKVNNSHLICHIYLLSCDRFERHTSDVNYVSLYHLCILGCLTQSNLKAT